jgi:hypothetical protein
MCTLYYVPAECKERCTARPINIRVILKFSSKQMLAFKYPPRHRNLFSNGWELDGADHLCAGRRHGLAVGFGRLLGDTVHYNLTHHKCTSTQLFTFPYRNSTRIHLLTHSSSGLEPGPDSDRATHKIPAAQLHTSSHPPITPQHSPFPHTSIHHQWPGRPHLVGIHLQPCGAASNLPAALARSPPAPRVEEGAIALVVWATVGSPLGAWRLE